jgi:hypothetical protein
MKKILFTTTALLLSLVVLTEGSPQRAAAQGKGGGSPVTGQLVANLDLNKAVSDIATAITSQKDRAAWVQAMLEEVKSRTQGRLSIVVFNMQQGFVFNPPPGTFKFTRATFNGGLSGNITYGVWAFSSGTTFTNQGDGGFINWAFYGVFTRNRGVVTFQDASVMGGSNLSLRVRPQIATTNHKRATTPNPKKR